MEHGGKEFYNLPQYYINDENRAIWNSTSNFLINKNAKIPVSLP